MRLKTKYVDDEITTFLNLDFNFFTFVIIHSATAKEFTFFTSLKNSRNNEYNC